MYTDPESGIGRLEASHVPTVKGKTTNERQMIMWADAKAAALHGLYCDVDVMCIHNKIDDNKIDDNKIDDNKIDDRS
eukprot:COSAG06_NODE_6583_length_2869_cov_4.277965_3_plen_77_part_00